MKKFFRINGSNSETWLRKIPLWKCFAIFSFLFVAGTYPDLVYWKSKNTPFITDANQYYSYLPATFIHGKVNFDCPTDYWLYPTKTGDFVPKMTMGVALMEIPLFYIGDYFAYHNGYPQDGYSPPYIWASYFGVIFYVFMGLWFLYKMLILFYKPLASLLTVIVVFYATNLLFYTVSWGQMSHSFSFTLFCIFLFHTMKWYKEKKTIHLLALSLMAGWCVLIRPSDITLLFIPGLIGMTSLGALKEKWSFMLSRKLAYAGAGFLFLLPLSFQLVYWKIHTGGFFFDTYSGEKFFFGDPQIINFLFSYRKGLFLYTPAMALAFAGFVPLFKKQRDLFWAIAVYTISTIYVLSSWWDWSFGGSFGSRAMIQSFAVLAIPLCALFSLTLDAFVTFWKKTIVLAATACLVFWLASFNLLMTKQFINGWLNCSDMSKEAYWYLFNKEELHGDEWKYLESLYKPKDTERMKKGDRNQ